MKPYKIYTDKSSDFQCEIEIEGASLNHAKARLVVSSNNKTVLYEGKIDGSGNCLIPIPRVKGLFEESDNGTMSLEIIVEDESYFNPWNGSFQVQTAKKVKVTSVLGESVEQSNKPKMKVNVKEQISPYEIKINAISEFLETNGITPKNILKKKRLVYEAINRVFVNESIDKDTIISDIVYTLSSGE